MRSQGTPHPYNGQLKRKEESMDEKQMVSLENLGRGAAIEQFAEEFRKVLENIVDPNTPAKNERTITLEVKIKPNDNRDYCVLRVSCSSKLSPVKAFETQMFVGRDFAHGGVVVATEHNPQQLGLNMSPADKIAAGVEAKEEGQHD
jgi:hypothetical protein